MSALTSLLVRDRVIPVSKIEDALQQQVLSATDIDTVLLEMNLVPEDVLAGYRAASFGLLPATRDEVMRAPREAIEHCPPSVACEQRVVPILLEGRALVVAAAEPLAAEAMQLLARVTACDVSIRIVTAPRVRAALFHHYAAALDTRTARLIENLRRREPGIIPYVRPASPTQRPSASTPSFTQAPVQPPDLLRELGLPEAVSLRAPRSPDAGAPGTSSVVASATRSVGSIGAQVREDAPASAAGKRALSTMPPPSISAAVSRGARGPLPELRLAELLSEATHRDDVLYILLRYASQFFDFVTLFTVSKDHARGRLSHGAGLTTDVLDQVSVPLSGNGVFARAVRDKRPAVGDIGSSPEERMAAALLGRPTQRPGLAVPFQLQGRAVLLLFAERDGEGLSESDAAPLLSIAVPVGHALRRIILEGKTLTRSGPPGALPAGSVPALEGDGSALEEDSALGDEHARVTPSAEPASAHDPALSAVDLDSVARLSAQSWDDALVHMGGSGAHVPRDGAAQDGIPGVPKSAPPPPTRASMSPPGFGAGSPAGSARSAQPPTGMRASMPPPGSTAAGGYSFGNHGVPPAETIRAVREAPAAARALHAEPAAARLSPPEPALDSAVDERAPGRDEARISQPGAQRTADPSKRLVLVPNTPEPSVIIDMGEPVRVLVDQLASAAPTDPMPELRELLRLGEGVLPVLIQRFPGPLWFDIAAIQVRAPYGRNVSAIALALVSFGERAAPYLATLLGTASGEVAICALLVAGELVQPELLDAVSRRVLDPDGDVRYVALCALRAYTRLGQFPSVLRALSDISERPGKDPRRQRLAVEALGELRDHRALRALLARLADPQEGIAQAAHRALVELTLQDFGPLPRKWDGWAHEHGEQHRVEWLIQALMHADPGLRAVAADELKRITQQYFGYHPALPKRERELSQRKYRDWWEQEGVRNF